jgi:hypothetical protein
MSFTFVRIYHMAIPSFNGSTGSTLLTRMDSRLVLQVCILYWNFSSMFTDMCHRKVSREATDLSRKVRHKAYARGVELYVGYFSRPYYIQLILFLKKSGELDHSLLHDILEEFGDQEDAQDATSMLYLGEWLSLTSISDVLIQLIKASSDTVCTQNHYLSTISE